MITPELLSYIRGELAKGRTREEVRVDLVKGGGWKEEDLSEAFRIVIPMQGFFVPTSTKENPASITSPSSVVKPTQLVKKDYKPMLKKLMLALILGGLFFVVWFYRAPLTELWNSLMSSVQDKYSDLRGSFNDDTEVPVTPVTSNTPVTKSVLKMKDCGTNMAIDLKKLSTYQTEVMDCIGRNAISCSPAKAVINDSLFPTILQITNVGDQDICDFRLSYAEGSELVDNNGDKLAGQYIICPINVVKMVDESSTSLKFQAPTMDNSGLYAGQIYFYGILGLFMEQDVDKSKILALGCSGPYIDSVVESFNSAKSGR